MSRITIIRMLLGGVPLLLGINAFIMHHFALEWRLALTIFGSVALLHLIIESSLSRLSKNTDNTNISLTKFQAESVRQLINWLIVSSGVIIGLIVKDALSGLGVVAVFSLVLCILTGFIHIGIFAGGVSKEVDQEIQFNSSNYGVSEILLNLTFVFFLTGVIALSIIVIKKP